MVAKRDDWLSVEDFLALDRESFDQKYEYRNGRMVAMAGGTANHGILIGNTYALIHPHLKKSPCFAFVEGTLKIEDECFLPDIMVSCNEQNITENKTYIEHPKLVIEVLSASTEKEDRGEKFPPVKLLLERGILSCCFKMRYASSKSHSRAAKVMCGVIPCSIPVFSNNDEFNTKSM